MIKPFMVIAIVIVLVMFASEVILGQLSSLRLIGSRGRVKVVGVGVYWDSNCSSPVYSVDWGSVEANSVKNITVFIRNEGNEPSNLFLNTTNWDPPSASDFIKLGWDYNGNVISPQQRIRVTLMLSIAPIIEGIKEFAFDIIISING